MELELCLKELTQSHAIAEIKNLIEQNSVENVEKNKGKRPECAKNARKNTRQSPLQTKYIAQKNVDTLIKKQIKQCIDTKEKEKFLNVDNAKKRMLPKNHGLEEGFATKNVSICITEGKIVQHGKEGEHQRDKNYIHPQSGRTLLKLSGKETMQLVRIALQGSLTKKDNNFISTMLNLSVNTQNLELTQRILLSYVKNVIYGYTAEQTLIPNLSIEILEGYTEGVADSHRYNMLGDGWTVDVIAHIFKGLKNI